MARDIDGLPLYDPLVSSSGNNNLSSIWVDALATLILTLQEYLTGSGIDVPRLTTDERDSLVNVTNGRIIYNTSTNKFQGFENSSWVNLI